MLKFEDFIALKLGESLEYFRGDLANSRVKDKALNNLAERLFACSTAAHCAGIFELKQEKISEQCYCYLAKRVREGR